ncbi:MAG: response regulator [Pirellulaceae bacterium]|nr:response regulator [Pirellulaceae bacterium]
MNAAHGDPAVMEPALAIAQRQTTKVSRLVDDLLDISRLLRNRIELKLKPLDAGALMESAIETIRSQIQLRKHTLTLKLPAEPLMVSGDQTRLCQVLENILENACKYTHVGGELEASVQRLTQNVIFCIKDNGPGISNELTPHIFDLFSQGSRTLDRSQGGLGIGLTVVKQIVDLHGGEVRAHSAGLGQGSQFTIVLPLLEQPSATEVPASPSWQPAAKALRVLIVDDNQDLATMTARLVELLGHQVRVAHEGAAAIATAQSFTPDVVLLDIGLPKMDGYAVVKHLRTITPVDEALIVAVTGYGQAGDHDRALSAGFDGHYVKPLSVPVLQELLVRAGVRQV